MTYLKCNNNSKNLFRKLLKIVLTVLFKVSHLTQLSRLNETCHVQEFKIGTYNHIKKKIQYLLFL